MTRRLAAMLGVAIVLGVAVSTAGPPRPVEAVSNCGLATYWCVYLDLTGDGTGDYAESWYQFDSGPQVSSGVIACHRAGGTTSGSCHQEFNIGFTTVSKITIYGFLTPGTSSHPCDPTCLNTSSAVGASFSSTTKSYTKSDFGFQLVDPTTVTVQRAGTGTGTVTSSPVGISCGSKCSSDFELSSSVGLSAVADTGSVFAGWGGPCSGTGSCSFAANSQTVTATFNSTATPTPAPTATPSPLATATPKPSSTASSSPNPSAGSTPTPRPSGSQPATTPTPIPSQGGLASISPAPATSLAPGETAGASTGPSDTSAGGTAPGANPGASGIGSSTDVASSQSPPISTVSGGTASGPPMGLLAVVLVVLVAAAIAGVWIARRRRAT